MKWLVAIDWILTIELNGDLMLAMKLLMECNGDQWSIQNGDWEFSSEKKEI